METLGNIKPDPVAHAQREVERLAGLQQQLTLDRERLIVELETAESNAGEASIRARLGDSSKSLADGERLARSVSEDLARTERDITTANKLYPAALIALDRARCTALRKTAAEKRAQAEDIRQRVRPPLEQIGAIEGVKYTFAILESQRGFEPSSSKLLREATAAEREARSLEQAQRFRDAAGLRGMLKSSTAA
jgi:hypothetical protein